VSNFAVSFFVIFCVSVFVSVNGIKIFPLTDISVSISVNVNDTVNGVQCSRSWGQVADVITRVDLNHNVSPVQHSTVSPVRLAVDIDGSRHVTTQVGCCSQLCSIFDDIVLYCIVSVLKMQA